MLLAQVISPHRSSIVEMLLLLCQQEGRLLSSHPSASWAELCAGAFESVSQNSVETVDDACVGLELLMQSLDLLDDVEDEELSPEMMQWSTSSWTNLSTMMMAEGLVLVYSATDRVGARGLHQRIAALLAIAAAGQARDLESPDLRDSFQVSDALALARQRSGALGRLAAECGASLGGGSPEQVHAIGTIGQQLTIYGQLMNDLHDVGPRDNKQGDLVHRKPTLPLVVARDHLDLPFDALTLENVNIPSANAVSWALARAELARARTLVIDNQASNRFFKFMPEPQIL